MKMYERDRSRHLNCLTLEGGNIDRRPGQKIKRKTWFRFQALQVPSQRGSIVVAVITGVGC